MTRGFSAHVMSIFMKKNNSISNGLVLPIFTLETLTTVTIFLNLKNCFAEDN